MAELMAEDYSFDKNLILKEKWFLSGKKIQDVRDIFVLRLFFEYI